MIVSTTVIATITAAAAQPAELLSPEPGAELSERQTFTWEDIGAEAYQIVIGTHPDSQDVAISPAVRVPTAEVAIEPNGHPLYVTLSSLVDGKWTGATTEYRAPGRMITMSECAATTDLWVLDVGTQIEGEPWVLAVDDPIKGPSHRFTVAASDHEGSPMQQADVGCGNGNFWSRGRWDLSGAETISFGFKDLNPDSVDDEGNSTLLHYVLLYDRNYRYHQWRLNDPTGPHNYTFKPGEWVDVTVSLSDDPNTYSRAGYNLAEPFDWSEVIFFEVGIFGENVAPLAKIVWEITGVRTN